MKHPNIPWKGRILASSSFPRIMSSSTSSSSTDLDSYLAQSDFVDIFSNSVCGMTIKDVRTGSNGELVLVLKDSSSKVMLRVGTDGSGLIVKRTCIQRRPSVLGSRIEALDTSCTGQLVESFTPIRGVPPLQTPFSEWTTTTGLEDKATCDEEETVVSSVVEKGENPVDDLPEQERTESHDEIGNSGLFEDAEQPHSPHHTPSDLRSHEDYLDVATAESFSSFEEQPTRVAAGSSAPDLHELLSNPDVVTMLQSLLRSVQVVNNSNDGNVDGRQTKK